MLCDGVESAVRTLSEPTPGRIEGLVHQMMMDRLADGQFEECDITLRELHTVEESLVKSLCAIYHGRIVYPSAKEPGSIVGGRSKAAQSA
jgi:membrane-associated HD superfamily phosphohydrolase